MHVPVTLSAPSSQTVTVSWRWTVSDAVGFALIRDDDPPPTIVTGVVAGLEGNVGDTTLLVRIALSAPSGQTVSVNWATLDAAAQPQAGVDYAPGSGTLTFAPGETSKTVPFVPSGTAGSRPVRTCIWVGSVALGGCTRMRDGWRSGRVVRRCRGARQARRGLG